MAERGIGPRTDTDFAHGGLVINGFGIEYGSMVALPPRGDGAHAMVVRCLEVTRLMQQIFGAPNLEEGGQFRFATSLERTDDNPDGRYGYVPGKAEGRVVGPTPATSLLTVVRQPGARHPWVCHSRPLQAGSGRPKVLVFSKKGGEGPNQEDTVGKPLEFNRWLFEMAEKELRPENIIGSLQARVAELEAQIAGLRHVGNFVVGRLRPHPKS